ncbi:hypothetical protein TL16_g11458 [Triparma laevis f. inornata]|uniref:SH3 domain-containing protein n=1 Tax=Triparma laevis f. inornata TaxID=1714386 RepID=A0A9W7BFF5_9STRA|nr:hypothetical protein TL16_g11458 [Triparma laevis f. inornata]
MSTLLNNAPTTINTANAIFSSFVLIKKKPKARLSLSSLGGAVGLAVGLSSKYKRRLMSLKPGPLLCIYDLTSVKEPRLAQSIALNNSCELKQSGDRGEEQCLVLQYQNEKNHTEEFVFYPENTDNTKAAKSDEGSRQSISKRLSRSFSTTSTNNPDSNASTLDSQCDDVDFESARKSVRLSIGAVTIMNRWRQVLTCSIEDTKMVDDSISSKGGSPSLAALLQKKTLTLEEAEIIKQHMKMERPFTGGSEPIQFNVKPDEGEVDEVLDECDKLEAMVSKEIQQQEVQMQKQKEEKEKEEKKPPPPPRRSSSNIDEKMKIFERKSSGGNVQPPPPAKKAAPVVVEKRTSIKDRIANFENREKEEVAPPPMISTTSSPTSEITKMLGSKTISGADSEKANILMRQVSGSEVGGGGGGGRSTLTNTVPIRQAQDNMFRSSEIGEELLEQTLEAELDQVIVGTSTTLPTTAIKSKNDQLQRKPPPPPRRNSNAEFDFEKSEEWQVGLQEGEKVRVLSKMNDGWTKVRKESGEEGMVPTDYLIDGSVKN